MFYIYAGDELIYRPLEPELSLLNPKLTLEMGKAGSLEFGIPSTNKHYNTLAQLVTTVRVSFDNEEIFYGRVLSVKKAFNNVKTVYCEGDLSYLIDTVQKCTKYNGSTHDLFNKIIAAHNARADSNKQFTVGNVTIENRSIRLEGQVDNINVGQFDYKQIAINSIVDEWNNTFDFIKTTLIDYCGGYLRTRHANGVAYIDYVADYFDTASQTIELGKNLLDLNDELAVDELFTVLIPLGDENLTISSVNGGSDELVNQELVNKYGRIVKTHVFSNVNQASTLKSNAERYMASHAETLRTIEISAVDLHMINPAVIAIHLGDKVTITSLPHGINEALTCTKIEYDMTNAANNKYTFGNPKQTLTERYREDERKQKDTYGNSAASSVGSGGGGGAIAAAAAAAADDAAGDAKDDATDKIDKLYNTYIKVDESSGEITLESIYKDLKGCGIYLDAGDALHDSNINIRAWKKGVDDETANIRAGVGYNEETGKYGSYIELNAQSISTNASNIEAANANISALSGDFQKLITGKLTATALATQNISTALATVNGNLSVNNGFIQINQVDVLTKNHTHSITCNETTGEIKFGTASASAPNATTSFSMAATKFFQDSMAAAEDSVIVNSLVIDTTKYKNGYRWGTNWAVSKVYLNATLSTPDRQTRVVPLELLFDSKTPYTEGQKEAHSHYTKTTLFERGSYFNVPMQGSSFDYPVKYFAHGQWNTYYGTLFNESYTSVSGFKIGEEVTAYIYD